MARRRNRLPVVVEAGRRRPIPVLVGTGGFLCGAGFVFSEAIRAASPVYHSLGALAFVWQLLLLFGGLAAMYGTLAGRPKWESSGLFLLAGGLEMYVAGSVWTRGLASWTAGIAITFCAALPAVLRAYSVMTDRPWL